MIGKILVSGFLFLATMTATTAAENRPPSQTFRVGERLSYDVRWFVISAGDASLAIEEVVVINGQPCYHFVGKAKSQLLFFFKVDDRIDSYSTADTLLPVRFRKRLQEGNYKKDLTTTFNQKNRTAQYRNETFPVDPDCRDPLGGFYYFRTLKLPDVGGEINVGIHTDTKNYPLLVRVLKREKIKVPAGEFNTILVELCPQPGFEGLFRHKGDIKIWLSDDNARILVRAEVEIPILGALKIELKNMKRS